VVTQNYAVLSTFFVYALTLIGFKSASYSGIVELFCIPDPEGNLFLHLDLYTNRLLFMVTFTILEGIFNIVEQDAGKNTNLI